MTNGALPRRRSLLRGAALVAAGACLVVAIGGVVLFAELRLDGGRLIRAALGDGELIDLCRPPLVRHLVDSGFEPNDITFGPAPVLGSPWAKDRSFGDGFTFTDGAAGTRVDGVMACVVSGRGVTVDVRVGSAPHRTA